MGKTRNRRGAALMFALAAVIIVMTVILGMWSLMVSHVDIEEASRNYSRAMQIAEAGANWQLSQMSRCLPPGNPGGLPGYVPYQQFRAANTARIQGDPQPLDWRDYSRSSDFQMPGLVKAYTIQAGGVDAWAPPQNFIIVSIGVDPETGEQRLVRFTGAATGLTDRYVLFANNNLIFNSSASDPNKNIALRSGYIGTNRSLTFTHQIPKTSGAGFKFSGCRLGLSADTQPQGSGGWPNGWDVLRQTDTVFWPTVSEVTQYIYQGRTPNEVGTMAHGNEPNQMWYRTEDDKGNVRWEHFTNPVLQLGNAEFNKSTNDNPKSTCVNPKTGKPYRVLCLSVSKTNLVGNLFYFRKIDMGDDDILVLDVGPPPDSTVSNGPDGVVTLRILLDGAFGTTHKVTNLAYCTYGVGKNLGRFTGPSIIWYVNSVPGNNGAISFKPNVDVTNQVIATFDTGGYLFTANPTSATVQGLVYGGDVTVQSNAKGITINQIIADNITLDATQGGISVVQPNSTLRPIETRDDPYRYVLYYRVNDSYVEGKPGSYESPNIPAPQLMPPINYGKAIP
ncbi:MAG TPA: hypothetical protein VFB21_17635 [Chthonomonadaceae bacterium]|nr:hypothetical protein [Chthonomonadaceae bacterium]